MPIARKYPVANTAYPTKIDDRIAKMTDWLEQNNHPLWEIAQSAPSEITFKRYIISFLFANSPDAADWCDGKTDVEPLPVTVSAELLHHPDMSLADLEWEYNRVKHTIAGPRIKARIDEYKRTHGITD